MQAFENGSYSKGPSSIILAVECVQTTLSFITTTLHSVVIVTAECVKFQCLPTLFPLEELYQFISEIIYFLHQPAKVATSSESDGIQKINKEGRTSSNTQLEEVCVHHKYFRKNPI